MSLIKGIHHVSMKCTCAEDYRRVRQFYCEILGLPVAREWKNGIMLDTGSGIVEFFLDGKEPMPKGVINHFALLTDSVDACVKAVTEAGYEVFTGPSNVTIPSDPPYALRMAFCHGPLGEEIEFFEEH